MPAASALPTISWVRNPKTKEEIKIPASKVPAFKAGKALKFHHLAVGRDPAGVAGLVGHRSSFDKTGNFQPLIQAHRQTSLHPYMAQMSLTELDKLWEAVKRT